MENDTQKEKNNTAIDILDQIKAKILSGKINVLDMETNRDYSSTDGLDYIEKTLSGKINLRISYIKNKKNEPNNKSHTQEMES